MKRVWFAIGLFLVLLVGSVTVSIVVRNYAEETKQLVTEAEKAIRIENPKKAVDICEQAAEIWEKRCRFLTTVLRHDATDDVETGLRRLIAYAQTEDTDEFLAMSQDLTLQLKHIQDMEKPYLRNIL